MDRGKLEMLAGLLVLVVEDEPLLAMDLADELKEAGACVLGPAHALEQALNLIQATQPQAAIVDILLDGVAAYPIADLLLERGVPFLLTSGMMLQDLPERFQTVPNCAKPISSRDVVSTLAALI